MSNRRSFTVSLDEAAAPVVATTLLRAAFEETGK